MFDRKLLVPLVALMLSACGTTSNLQPEHKAPEKKTPASAPQAIEATPTADITGYDRVIVTDFLDATDKSKLKPADLAAYEASVAMAGRDFADLIAQRLRATNAFQEVLRTTAPGRALVVSGKITRLNEGNATARLLLPGAGASHFDATTELVDNDSGSTIGHLTTAKNSWVLGGGLAATQTVQSFMQGAADKVASQLKEQKVGTHSASAH